MKIAYIQKTSFIDYPGKICAIVFTQGCNFRCPYCHNPELVFPDQFSPAVSEEEFFGFLDRRKNRLDAVSITGGEPTMQGDLLGFMQGIKEKGFLLKLDSNGTRPDILNEIIHEGLVDYLAMDVKAPLERYADVVEAPVDISDIESSIHAIMTSGIRYEFRTTLSRSLLTPDDIVDIGKLIEGASQYFLQRFTPSKHVDTGFINEHSFTDKEIDNLVPILQGYVKDVQVR
ncbi:MAG: anaerobic ribonucleoside-triphosphate reductase activating protein [Thermodesulfobacteriota bacterium]|nr:anaerobic ribonucleoside-triphosphate reductase activating protein [Thermodesulfobacteriota bacterium]